MAGQLERLEQLLAEQEKRVRDAFREFIRSVNSEHVWAALADLIEAGNVNEAMAVVDSYVVRFGNVLPQIQSIVGAATAQELTELAGDLLFAVSFDPSHPRAAAMARANRLTLVREFTAEQRIATRQMIASSFETGAGTAATARAFRASIGLNSQQAGWVVSFEQRLRNLDRKALNMVLRDRRYDKTLERAFDLRRPLTEAQIERMVERYRARALIYRSENIARTEALRATSQARRESLRQMLEQTGMDPRRITRIWNATRDKRTRDWHADMQQQRVGIDEKFVDGKGNALLYPGDPEAPGETTINCRCVETFEIKPPLQDFAA